MGHRVAVASAGACRRRSGNACRRALAAGGRRGEARRAGCRCDGGDAGRAHRLRPAQLGGAGSLSHRHGAARLLLHAARGRCRRLLHRRRPRALVGGGHEHLRHDAFRHHVYGLSCQSLRHRLDVLPDARHYSPRVVPRHPLLPAFLPPAKRNERVRISRAPLQRCHAPHGQCLVHRVHGGAHGAGALSPLARAHGRDGHRYICLHRADGLRHDTLLHDGRR